MNRPTRVLVAMSGGVDSSVAACLLHEQGYEVVGVFMRLGTQRFEPATADLMSGSPAADARMAAASLSAPRHAARSLSLPVAAAEGRSRGCCSAADAGDARLVAGRLNIPFYSLNFEADFEQLVDYFVDEYAQARTPNPCVRCNQWLKFGRLLEYAAAVEADLVATGHYARVDRDGPRPRLFRAVDERKDQSYVLFGVPRNVLARTMFPLGELTKPQVREHARRFGLALHDKPESQDICFVPDRDYARLVKSRRGDAFRPGPIVHVDGRRVGTHEGIAHFTVGQRRGLRVAAGEPIYVTTIDPATDTVYVGPRDAVRSNAMTVRDINWLAEVPCPPFRAAVKIRYQHAAAEATIWPFADGQAATVRFDEPQAAVTPGQAAVFYSGDEVLGGGWINRAGDGALHSGQVIPT